ncbi:2908_t:CDS:2 [Entrophospora sp. SA101]|nr:2908_t:CDS:2 [Entrophospora sp. SA101]
MVEERTVPQQSLARLFPQGFPEFWAKLEFKKDLEQVIYSYTPATLTHEEIKKTLASGGYGLGSQKNTPIFANVDLGSGQFGGFQRQNQLSTQNQEQGQGNRSSNRKNTTDKINHVGKEFYRSQKDANVATTTQDSYQLAPVLGKILNAFQFTIIELSKFYPLFEKLMLKTFGCTVKPIIDPETGRRSLPYLERLKTLHQKTEKEYKKLPDTNNRKPRIALRLKTLEGCLKAYEPEYIELPTLETFRSRIRGEVEGYTKVIGYQNILQIVEKYLRSYHFAKRNNTPPPAQLMIMLLGEPGLGKTYISMAIARALGRGFHMVGMNGKLNASLITGTNIENPGAEPGEVLKAISRREDRACVICFDEIEKAARECKEAAGIPTDITGNKDFTDTFLDFPTPTNECIFIATVNRPEDVPNFVADRFAIKVEVLPLPYGERLEVVRVVLAGELKKLNNAFQRIYHQDWQAVFNLFDHEEFDFLEPETALPTDLVGYNWDFLQREGKDESCPYGKDIRNNHKVNCKCFTQNLDWVPVYNKEYQFLPLTKTFADWQKHWTEFFIRKHTELENLINSFGGYFRSEIIPVLESPEGDKTLLFRCKRILDNKIIGESSSLFLDLVIWEVEYRQQQQFKERLREFNANPAFLTDREDELMASDLEKLIDGRINYNVACRWYWK